MMLPSAVCVQPSTVHGAGQRTVWRLVYHNAGCAQAGHTSMEDGLDVLCEQGIPLIPPLLHHPQITLSVRCRDSHSLTRESAIT